VAFCRPYIPPSTSYSRAEGVRDQVRCHIRRMGQVERPIQTQTAPAHCKAPTFSKRYSLKIFRHVCRNTISFCNGTRIPSSVLSLHGIPRLRWSTLLSEHTFLSNLSSRCRLSVSMPPKSKPGPGISGSKRCPVRCSSRRRRKWRRRLSYVSVAVV
jgi:hypothetical protein